jgi:hypothetical protein
MSKLEVKEIAPISGETDLKLGQSGGTVTLADGATAVGFGGESPVKAWVNFNGTGTVAIRDSLNVSSVTDNGAGDYTVNFTTAMPDANYAVTAACFVNSTVGSPIAVFDYTTSSVRIKTSRHDANNGAFYDADPISVVIVGN